MKVWIDQSYCTGNGLCVDVAPDVFVLIDGLGYVKEGKKVFAACEGNPEGVQGVAVVPAGLEDAVLLAAQDCPGECIYVS